MIIKASSARSPIPTPESPNPVTCLSAEIFIHSVGFRLFRGTENAPNSVLAMRMIKNTPKSVPNHYVEEEKHSKFCNFVPNHSAELKNAQNSVPNAFTEKKKYSKLSERNRPIQGQGKTFGWFFLQNVAEFGLV
jgi:hypothetical protein